ncbi:helix-turn-helix domain-containing protein [Flavobacteriaceae bacterium AU392]|nr:helix-turn-helix domain-containing protein [Flavobacteriaceae bacterium]RKM84930.1 helix-turn-helix domain-containing protein [Flavobacteriaceae bacterium AU392]
MKCLKNIFQIGIIIMMISSLYAQETKAPDSILSKSYNELDSLYYINEYTEKGKQYINTYLKKAKLETNIEEILKGYHLFADFYDNNYDLATTYIDSAITLINKTEFKNQRYPAALFGKKGYIERIEGNFQEALNYYLKELNLLSPVTNNFRINYTNYNIGLIKRDYGDFEGAISIFKKNLKFDENRLKLNPEDREGYLEPYLNTLFELVRTYRLNKELDSAKTLNSEGLKIGKGNALKYLLVLNDGIFDYYDGQFKSSIEKIILTLPKLQDVNNRLDFEIYKLIDAYFYLGKSYEALNNDEQKLLYYNKIDSLTQTSNYLIPETKLTYLGLVNHYKNLVDNENQLKYLDKLITVDSILDINYKYINNKLETEYDIPNLIEDREQLIASLKNENAITSKIRLIISILLGLSLLGLGLFYVNQRRYKKRFKVLLKERIEVEKQNSISKIKKEQKLDLSQDTINHITQSLNKFEAQEKFLKTNLTLDKLAKSFKTNSKYLSYVLNQTKQKSVSQYINDLRIDYVVNRLKQDLKFRKFTIKAIANDIGFNTDQAFSKAFYKKTGIYPSYFIKELEKEK